MLLNVTIYFLRNINVLMLTEISTGLWTQVEPLSMIGIQFGNRTTVIASGGKSMMQDAFKVYLQKNHTP